MHLQVCSDGGVRHDPGQPSFDPFQANTWFAGSGTPDPPLTAAEVACALHTRSAGNGTSETTYPCSREIADDQGVRRIKTAGAAGEVVVAQLDPPVERRQRVNLKGIENVPANILEIAMQEVQRERGPGDRQRRTRHDLGRIAADTEAAPGDGGTAVDGGRGIAATVDVSRFWSPPAAAVASSSAVVVPSVPNPAASVAPGTVAADTAPAASAVAVAASGFVARAVAVASAVVRASAVPALASPSLPS